MFCWGANGVYVSRNAGESWEPVVTADQSVTISCMDAIGDFSEYGSIAYGTDGSRVFLSDDMGQTFQIPELGVTSALPRGYNRLSTGLSGQPSIVCFRTRRDVHVWPWAEPRRGSHSASYRRQC
jgi:photosystem II stability/assembly factor-like uncharacterized protein